MAIKDVTLHGRIKFKATILRCTVCHKEFFARNDKETFYCPCHKSWVEQYKGVEMHHSASAVSTHVYTYL